MKARISFVSVAFATLTMTAALMAQPPAGGFRRHAAPNVNATPPDPIAREVGMLTRFLDLDMTEQGKITAILTADSNNLATLRANLKTERTALIAAIKAPGNTGGVTTASAALSSTQAQIEAIRAAEAAAVYAVLSDAQKTKLGDGLGILLGGGGPGPGFGPGRRGGPPPKQ